MKTDHMGHLRLVHSAPTSESLGHPSLEAFAAELDYIYQSLRWLGASSDTIDDLAHEVFLSLARKWPEAGAPEPLRPHLFGLALQVVRRRGPRGDGDAYANDLARQRSRSQHDPSGDGGVNLLETALGQLPLLRRSVLVLHDIDGNSIPEIASALSMARWAVRWRLRSARRDLTAAVRHLASGGRRS
jgi:RNA polymerase sigma-70 factor (ECF subfamily)